MLTEREWLAFIITLQLVAENIFIYLKYETNLSVMWMLSLIHISYDYLCNQNEASKKNYFTVFDYAIDQGFAFGSGMGTNHHYGYQIRKIYTTCLLYTSGTD